MQSRSIVTCSNKPYWHRIARKYHVQHYVQQLSARPIAHKDTVSRLLQGASIDLSSVTNTCASGWWWRSTIDYIHCQEYLQRSMIESITRVSTSTNFCITRTLSRYNGSCCQGYNSMVILSATSLHTVFVIIQYVYDHDVHLIKRFPIATFQLWDTTMQWHGIMMAYSISSFFTWGHARYNGSFHHKLYQHDHTMSTITPSSSNIDIVTNVYVQHKDEKVAVA